MNRSWDRSCIGAGANGNFGVKFAHKRPDLHRNKGLAAAGFCAMILSTEEQSSRRREQNEAVRSSGNAAQAAHGKPGVAGDSRATGKFQDGGEDAHAHDGVTETYGSAGASSQARTRSASTGRDQVAEARSSINRKKGREPERELAPSAFQATRAGRRLAFV